MHIVATYRQDSDPILLFSENGKYGLCDQKRGILCDAVYDEITPCGKDGFLLLRGRKYGFVRFEGTKDDLPAAWISCSYDHARLYRHGIEFHNGSMRGESYLMEDFLFVDTYTGKSYPAHSLEQEWGRCYVLCRINEANEMSRTLILRGDKRTFPLGDVNIVGEMPLDDWSDCLLCEELQHVGNHYIFHYFFWHLDDETTFQSEKCVMLRDTYAMLAAYVQEKFPPDDSEE